MTMCPVKDVAHSDESTKHYRPTFRLFRALWSVLASLSTFWGFFGQQTQLSSSLFPVAASRILSKKALISQWTLPARKKNLTTSSKWQMTMGYVTMWKGSLVVMDLPIVSFSSMLSCLVHNFTVLVHSYGVSWSFSEKTLWKLTAHYLLSIKEQADTVCD